MSGEAATELASNDPGAAAQLSCRGLAKSYGSMAALSDIDFDVAAGEIVALCGENGAGKSTLVKIITGLTAQDDGTVAVAGIQLPVGDPRAAQAHGVAIVDQELSLLPDLSVFDNIWLGNARTPFLHRRRSLRAQARTLLDELGCAHISLDGLAGSLTLGERQLVEIARMLSREASVLILDEPTATLSDVEIDRIFHALRGLAAQGKSILFVSHRLAEVFALCHRVVVLRNGATVAEAAIDQMTRAQLVTSMLGRKPTDLYPDQKAPSTDVVLEVSELTVPGRVAGLSLRVCGGEIVGLAGQLGSGAGTVVRAIAGLEPTAQGEVRLLGRRIRPRSAAIAAGLGIRYLSDDRAGEGVYLERSIQQNLVALRLSETSSAAVLSPRRERRIATKLAAAVGVPPDRLRHDVITLSGGNQQKVAIGRLFDLSGGTVLLLHEPTRGVDVGSRAEIYRIIGAMAASGYAVVVVSTDLEELTGVCDRIHTLYRGRPLGHHRVVDVDSETILGEITHGTAAGDLEHKQALT